MDQSRRDSSGWPWMKVSSAKRHMSAGIGRVEDHISRQTKTCIKEREMGIFKTARPRRIRSSRVVEKETERLKGTRRRRPGALP